MVRIDEAYTIRTPRSSIPLLVRGGREGFKFKFLPWLLGCRSTGFRRGIIGAQVVRVVVSQLVQFVFHLFSVLL